MSHPLSLRELQTFSKLLGYMPKVTELHTDSAPLPKVHEHLAQLDAALRSRVQNLCDTLHARHDGDKRWLCLRALGRARQFIRPGIIQEVWPEMLFYLLYSIVLQFYAHSYEWDFHWSAFNQDTVYYPALMMAFLLSFRASDCMARYQTGCHCIFEMEKRLRELAYEVITKLSMDSPKDSISIDGFDVLLMRKRYFKHELRRLTQVLFAIAARDLNDSAIDGNEALGEEEAGSLQCSLTDVELAAIHVTNSTKGHVFRVYLAASWLLKLVDQAFEDELFEDEEIHKNVQVHLNCFKAAWMKARQVAYTSMPGSIIHLLWVLANAINFVLPWEYVSVCRWMTWLPSLFISLSFFGIVHIAANMENPFGFDDDDIPIGDVAEHLDEEVSLIMFYSALDEVGGENAYRGLIKQDHIYVD